MRLAVIAVPFHLGRPGAGAGGPEALLRAGLEQRLRDERHDVRTTIVRNDAPPDDELEAILAVSIDLAAAVRDAVAHGRFPLVLGADCNIALGVTSGLGATSTALVWFDAHGDFNTPETTPGGYLDGMPLSMVVGRCFQEQVDRALGSPRVPENHVLHLGARALDAEERRNFETSDVMLVEGERLQAAGPTPAEAIWPALAGLRHGHGETRAVPGSGPAESGAAAPAGVPEDPPAGKPDDTPARGPDDQPAELPLERPFGLGRAYVHVDLDVLDPRYAPAVDFPVENGLTPEQVHDCTTAVHALLPLCALSVSAFDPDRPDPETRTVEHALDLIIDLVDAAGTAPTATETGRR